MPPDLRFLKILVATLAGTMIVGLITIIVLFVIRFPQVTRQAPALPDQITLPAGVKAQAVTMGTGWVAIVTDTNEILILDPTTSKVLQRVAIETVTN